MLFALYDHTAQIDDELSFTKGDRLTINSTTEERESEQWWKATNDKGQSGLVPSNYFSEFSPLVTPEAAS